MHEDGIEFLEFCKRHALERIALLTDPADEAAFRSWVHSYTARQPSDAGRVQGTRDSWQAERVADYMLEYHRQRESKVQALQREKPVSDCSGGERVAEDRSGEGEEEAGSRKED